MDKIIELLKAIDFNSSDIDTQVYTIFNLLYEHFPNQVVNPQTIEECQTVLHIKVKEELLENIAKYSENVFPVAVGKYIVMGVGLNRKQLIPFDDFHERYNELIVKSI